MQQPGTAAREHAGEGTKENEAGERRRPYVSIAGRRVPMPRSRVARIGTGVALVLLGVLGFLPVLGFWMIPLGLLVLSYDIPAVRRQRRRIEVWWHRRREKRRGRTDS